LGKAYTYLRSEMVSLLYFAFVGATLGGRTHLIRNMDVLWDTGSNILPVSIHVNDYVEFWTAVPIHSVWVGKQSSTNRIDRTVAACNITENVAIMGALGFTAVSGGATDADALNAVCSWPFCSFVSGPQSCAIDKSNCVNPPLSYAEVRVRHQFTSPGTYYAVCNMNDPFDFVTPPGDHCREGMHVAISVQGVAGDPERTPVVQQLRIPDGQWGLGRYPDIQVAKGDKVRFQAHTAKHDLLVVEITSAAQLIDESGDCGHTDGTVLIHYNASASDSAITTYDWVAARKGVFLFWCAQGEGFHCLYGMHFRVTVV